jgi:hypothetical protein
MTVLLHRSNDVPDAADFRSWLAVTGTRVTLDATRKLPRLANRLEESFMKARPLWWELGKSMTRDASAETAHAPTGAVYGSDFGLMLAWSILVAELANDVHPHAVICDDPWLFRHLAKIPGVNSGTPPGLFLARLHLRIRGVMARFSVCLRMARAYLQLSRFRRIMNDGDRVILVYGHPHSNAEGRDDYFGDMMQTFPGIKRLLHADCPPGEAIRLCADGRSAPIHAWGTLTDALSLLLEYWKPREELLVGANGWLVRRAAEKENGGGNSAMIRWQICCQKRWIENTRPTVVVWPWENFAWERALCRYAGKAQVRTAGYQHTAIGPHQINHSPASNADGLASFPDTVISDGPAYYDQLVEWGTPEGRIIIGGSLRIKQGRKVAYDPDGPVFVPLSAQLAAARQQLAAAYDVAATGRRLLVKEHPMYPLAFKETDYLKRTDKQMPDQPGISAVLFTTGTSGLEALLSGIPVVRILLEDRISVNILPEGYHITSVPSDQASACLKAQKRVPALQWEKILAPVDMPVWKNLFDPEDSQVQTKPQGMPS